VDDGRKSSPLLLQQLERERGGEDMGAGATRSSVITIQMKGEDEGCGGTYIESRSL